MRPIKKVAPFCSVREPCSQLPEKVSDHTMTLHRIPITQERLLLRSVRHTSLPKISDFRSGNTLCYSIRLVGGISCGEPPQNCSRSCLKLLGQESGIN